MKTVLILIVALGLMAVPSFAGDQSANEARIKSMDAQIRNLLDTVKKLAEENEQLKADLARSPGYRPSHTEDTNTQATPTERKQQTCTDRENIMRERLVMLRSKNDTQSSLEAMNIETYLEAHKTECMRERDAARISEGCKTRLDTLTEQRQKFISKGFKPGHPDIRVIDAALAETKKSCNVAH